MSEHNKHHGEGHPFFPGHLLKEAVVMLGVILFVMFLAVTVELPKESVADPTDTSYLPRPEWYFLFLFQFLKYFPGSMEVIAAVVFPAVGVGVLLLLPFLDKNPSKNPKQRPLAMSTAAITMLGVIVLTILGMDDGIEGTGQSFTFFEKWKYGLVIAIIVMNFVFTLLIVSKNSPIKDGASKFITASAVAVMSGLALVTVVVFSALQPPAAGAGGGGGEAAAPGKAIIESKCTSCHKIDGKGADFAPDLSKGSTKYKTVEELTKFLKDPASVGSGMPKQQLDDQEIKDIAEFLASLSGGGAGGSAPAAGGAAEGGAPAAAGQNATGDAGAGKGVFATNCKGCHKFNGDGGAVGPDLTDIAKKMDNAKLIAFIKDPAAAKPGTAMPKLPLTDADLQAVAAFLAGGNAAPAGGEAKAGERANAGTETKAPEAGAPNDPNVHQFALKTIEANACKSCHKINGQGGAFGPDLSKIGAKRDAKWLKDYLKDPKSVMPDTQMPVVPLSAEEINAIAAYFATLK